MKKVSIAYLAILSSFVLLFFWVRMLHYSSMPIYEEGMFVDIFYSNPQNPAYLLVGIINGEKIYSPPQHPAIIYEILSGFGDFWQGVIPNGGNSPYFLAFFSRAAFSIFQFSIIFLLLLAIIVQNKIFESRSDEFLSLLSVICLSLTPIAIKTSISLQVDGSVGVLLSGLVSLAIIVNIRRIFNKKVGYFILFLGGGLFGLGKNEWSLALLTAILVTGIFSILRTYRAKHEIKKIELSVLIFLLSGLLVGNLISYSFDPLNYLAGFDVMSRIHAVSDYSSPISIVLARVPILYILFFLLIIQLVYVVSHIKIIDTLQILMLLLSGFLLLGFLFSSWATDPRYYAPSFIVSVVSYGMIVSSERNLSKYLRILLWGFSICLFILASQQVISSFSAFDEVGEFLSQPAIHESSSSEMEGCIPHMGVGEAFGKNIDFVSNALNYDSAKELTQKYGRTVCEVNN